MNTKDIDNAEIEAVLEAVEKVFDIQYDENAPLDSDLYNDVVEWITRHVPDRVDAFKRAFIYSKDEEEYYIQADSREEFVAILNSVEPDDDEEE